MFPLLLHLTTLYSQWSLHIWKKSDRKKLNKISTNLFDKLSVLISYILVGVKHLSIKNIKQNFIFPKELN